MIPRDTSPPPKATCRALRRRFLRALAVGRTVTCKACGHEFTLRYREKYCSTTCANAPRLILKDKP